MAPKSSKKKTAASREFTDIFVPHVRGRGEVHVAKVISAINETDTITTEQLESALDLISKDDRFAMSGAGYETTVRMVDESTPAGEPEEVRLEEAMMDQAQRDMDPSARESFASPNPAPTGEAAPVPTIGEQLEAQAKTEEVEVTTTHEAADPIAAQRAADAMRAHQDKEAEEKRLALAIEALDSKITTVSADLKDTKDRRKVLQSELMASILGHAQTSLVDSEEDEEPDGAEQTPIAKAARGETPMIVEPPVAGMIRKQGAEQAIQGRTELDCPYSRENDARAVSMWFDGFREAKREDHTERPAIVQALTRDQMSDACLPCNGILQPGENTPKVPTVTWDHRPTLVLDMLADGEGPVAGYERWSLLPTYDRDEWANLFAETYGPAIADVDASDEAKAKRVAGGINAGRLVKCGRSKRVVGPLSTLSIATVKTEPAEERPPY